jgi:hypothetical protein
MFTTPVHIDPPPHLIDYESRILLTGSCFSENIGNKMNQAKFRVLSNPFGVLYNPASVSGALLRIISAKVYHETDLCFHQGLYFSFDHHSRYSRPVAADCIKEINKELETAHQFLKESSFLFISLGSALVYHHETKGIVANCHKIPGNRFTREMLEPEDCVELMSKALDAIFAFNKSIQVVFTISPVQYTGEGAHQNRISKAVLLLSVERLCKKYPAQTHYFPAYEIMQDELRDYRFYAPDMAHPSETALEYIWTRFSENWLSAEAIELKNRIEKIQKAAGHRPFFSASENHLAFVQSQIKEIENLIREHPGLDFTKELASLKQT